MNFYVIESNEKPIAVVFHESLSRYYSVRSSSEAFRKAFESSVKKINNCIFKKVDNGLKIYKFDQSNPSWCKFVLDQFCTDFWKVSEFGEIGYSETSETIAQKFGV